MQNEVMILTEHGIINWYREELRCPYCKRYNGLFKRNGYLIGQELHINCIERNILWIEKF